MKCSDRRTSVRKLGQSALLLPCVATMLVAVMNTLDFSSQLETRVAAASSATRNSAPSKFASGRVYLGHDEPLTLESLMYIDIFGGAWRAVSQVASTGRLASHGSGLPCLDRRLRLTRCVVERCESEVLAYSAPYFAGSSALLRCLLFE